jgi:putative oxidoreductase
MINFFRTDYKRSHFDTWLLVLRLAIAAFMLTHGEPKLETLLDSKPIAFSDPLGISPPFSLGLAVLAEFGCSILLALGLLTRPAALILLINMAVAAFIAHAGAPFGKRELALVYLLFYVTFFVLGAGSYSLDRLLARKRQMRPSND